MPFINMKTTATLDIAKKDALYIWTLTVTQQCPANVFAVKPVPQHAPEKTFTLEQQQRKNNL